MRDINLYFDSRDAKIYKEVLARQGEHLASKLLMTVPTELVGYKLIAIFELSDGTPVYTPELIAVGGVISYVLDKGLTSQTGDLKIELQAYEDVDAENKRVIKSAVTRIKIYNALLPVAEVMPEDYVPWYADVTVKTELATQKALEASTYANNARISAEGIVTQEDARASAETERVANELVRVAEEDEREDAENARVILESNRVTAESSRVNTESLRVSAESSRASAEALRVIAEANRKDGVDGKDGINGTNGVDGKDGYTPIKGVDYFDGQKGDKGDRGEIGLTGATGSTGEKGDRGEVGERGEQGIQGIPGESGYIHPTTPGNKHIPSGGTVGQILKNTADGEVAWSDDSVIGGSNISITTEDKEYTVSKTGSDTNDGSAEFPFLTIAKVDSMIPTIVNHNVSISVKEGVFEELIEIKNRIGTGSISFIGRESKVSSVDKINVIGCQCSCDFTNLTVANITAEGYSVNVDSSNMVLLNNLKCTKTISGTHIYIVTCSNVTISGNVISNGGTGVYAENVLAVYMDNNTGENNGIGIDSYGSCVYMSDDSVIGGTTGFVMENCGTIVNKNGMPNIPVKTATLTTTWVGTSAPYTQTVIVEGIKSTQKPLIGDIPTGTNAEKIAQKRAWNMVDEFDTDDGSITFTCFEEKPTVAINIQIKGV